MPFNIVRRWLRPIFGWQLRFLFAEEAWRFEKRRTLNEVLGAIRAEQSKSGSKSGSSSSEASMFSISMKPPEVEVALRMDLWTSLSGSGWYYFKGMVVPFETRSAIVGNYRSLTFVRLFLFVWFNSFFVIWIVMLVLIANSLLKDQFGQFVAFSSRSGLLFLGSLVPFALGRALVFLVTLSESRRRRVVKRFLEDI